MQRYYPNHPQLRQYQGQFYPPFPQQHPNQQHHHWKYEEPRGHGFHEETFIPQQAQMQRQISIENAIQIGREQVQGQVVKAELERESGRLVYEIDVINQQGIKYEVVIDANSGAVLQVELD